MLGIFSFFHEQARGCLDTRPCFVVPNAALSFLILIQSDSCDPIDSGIGLSTKSTRRYQKRVFINKRLSIDVVHVDSPKSPITSELHKSPDRLSHLPGHFYTQRARLLSFPHLIRVSLDNVGFGRLFLCLFDTSRKKSFTNVDLPIFKFKTSRIITLANIMSRFSLC